MQVESDCEDEGSKHDLETGAEWIGKDDNASNDGLPSDDDALPVAVTVLVGLIHETEEILIPPLTPVHPFAVDDDACSDDRESQREQDQTGPAHDAFQQRMGSLMASNTGVCCPVFCCGLLRGLRPSIDLNAVENADEGACQ